MKTCTVLFLLICTFWASLAHASSPCLKFSADSNYHGLEHASGVFVRLMGRANICVEASHLPAKRSHNMLKSGEFDGVIGRISHYQDDIGSEAVMVPTPVFSSWGILVSRKPLVNSLPDRNMRLGILRGWRWMTKTASDLKIQKLLEINKLETLVEVYNRQRVDGILLMEHLVRQFNLESEPVLYKAAQLNFHIWVHKRHQKLVPSIDKIISRYLNDGGVFVVRDFEKSS
ncbi:MAG: hypothetical protein JJ879_16435 [Sneathiella sp.]|nr:hypothetical protein [Sneathiella sp.]